MSIDGDMDLVVTTTLSPHRPRRSRVNDSVCGRLGNFCTTAATTTAAASATTTTALGVGFSDDRVCDDRFGAEVLWKKFVLQILGKGCAVGVNKEGRHVSLNIYST